MKANKKITAFFLILCLVFALAPQGLSAYAAPVDNNFSVFYNRDDGVLIIWQNQPGPGGPGAVPVLADRLENWDEIKASCRTIVLQEGIGEVPSGAFAGFSSLEEVVLPTTLRSVAADAFQGCGKLDTVRSAMAPELLSRLISGSGELGSAAAETVSSSDLAQRINGLIRQAPSAPAVDAPREPDRPTALKPVSVQRDEYRNPTQEVFITSSGEIITSDYTYTYDSQGAVGKRETVTVSSVGKTTVSAETFDGQGRPLASSTKMTDKEGAVVETETAYEHGQDGSMSSVSTQINYDPDGHVQHSSVRKDKYDEGRLSFTSSDIFDENGQLQQSTTSTTEYDRGSGLIAKQTMHSVGVHGDSTDRVTVFEQGVTSEATEKRILPDGSSTVFTVKYDSHGMESAGQNLQYDPAGQLVTITDVEYRLNPDGSRIAVKTVKDSAGNIIDTRIESVTIGVPVAVFIAQTPDPSHAKGGAAVDLSAAYAALDRLYSAYGQLSAATVVNINYNVIRMLLGADRAAAYASTEARYVQRDFLNDYPNGISYEELFRVFAPYFSPYYDEAGQRAADRTAQEINNAIDSVSAAIDAVANSLS